MGAQPNRERESDLGVVCAVQVACRGFRAARGRRGSGLSEELRCRCVSCGEDVSGDEIVFVLEQADDRKAGQCHPGCFGGTREIGALAMVGSERFRRVRPEPWRDGSLADVYEPGMVAGADAVRPCACC